MKTTLLDGYQLAENHKQLLLPKVQQLEVKPVIAAILFTEDAGSVLYTGLKQQMATDLGMGYEIYTFSLKDEVQQVVEQIKKLNQTDSITGIIVQKPWRQRFIEVNQLEVEQGKEQFKAWWNQLITAIEPTKDVDGLHPATLQAIKAGRANEVMLPATCRAVLALMAEAFQTDKLLNYLQEHNLKVVIIGKSDLLGQPLDALLQAEKISSEMIGSQELKTRIEQGIYLTDADVVVTATGRRKLVTGELIKEGAVVIDVGEPVGDVDLDSVMNKAKAVTPVPGGVGPMTVISLLENATDLVWGDIL